MTRFDIGGARVAAVDLQDVAPQGDDLADRQTAIMYMLARHAMVRSWWLGAGNAAFGAGKIPHLSRSAHSRHTRNAEAHLLRRIPPHQQDATPCARRSCATCAKAANGACRSCWPRSCSTISARTWSIWRPASGFAARPFPTAPITDTAERFGLSDTARWVMRYRLTGPRPSGAPVLLLLSTNEGRYEQHLVNTLGPIELWALSTSVEDVMLRTMLYTTMGAPLARQTLAKFFPGGSARQEIRRRVVLRTERGEVESGATSLVIQELAQELIEHAHQDPSKMISR